MKIVRISTVLIAFLVCASVSLAQSSNPAWIEDLGFEMQRIKDCEVAYLVRAEEGELGGQPTYSARVQCVDGRQFDATKIGENADYDIRECNIQAC